MDQTIFRGSLSSLRDVTPRILKRIAALPKLPVSEEGFFLFLIKWKEYHRLDNDAPEMTKLLELVRFPCMRGQFLADVVQPTGLVKMFALADYPSTLREVSCVLMERAGPIGNLLRLWWRNGEELEDRRGRE